MKKNKKTISLFLLLLSFTIVLADCSIYSFSNSPTINICNTCPDISNHFEHAHSHGVEDHVLFNETKSKTVHIFLQASFISTTEINLKNNYISIIWQPPKFS